MSPAHSSNPLRCLQTPSQLHSEPFFRHNPKFFSHINIHHPPGTFPRTNLQDVSSSFLKPSEMPPNPIPAPFWSRFPTIIPNFYSGSAPGATRNIPIHEHPGWLHLHPPHDQPRSSNPLRCLQTPSQLHSEQFFRHNPKFFSHINTRHPPGTVPSPKPPGCLQLIPQTLRDVSKPHPSSVLSRFSTIIPIFFLISMSTIHQEPSHAQNSRMSPAHFSNPLRCLQTPSQLLLEPFFHHNPKFFFLDQRPPSTRNRPIPKTSRMSPAPPHSSNPLRCLQTPSQLCSEPFFHHNPNFFSHINVHHPPGTSPRTNLQDVSSSFLKPSEMPPNPIPAPFRDIFLP
ncbi:arginine-glutamic acid dipeptide repeats protein-like [Vidua chalybeata]|uniref:arginine-glutamic acid dipeptide repeats protein-like n=1 Tax=Vidua chalybeata TaxID=81927 RepID=UPI0023A84A00|nr:arginine-glutamic acid dipeptide repeats protein-like [Vidua chalybeata]XP_053793821.1 arginine-glutamic acid dipeptide repeats protein-like [Vidua chalybeata]